ncbi:unnamed protein product, partial [Brassica oleracea var. botrytis]
MNEQRICSFDGVTSADASSGEEVVIGRLTIQKLRAELEVTRIRDRERVVELEATNKKLRMTSRAIAKEYSSLLGSLKDKWKSKKLEEMVEIHLQEVTANIFLTEITEGGLQAAGELQRLNENDIEFDTDFALATVSDQVLNELNLLQIFEES